MPAKVPVWTMSLTFAGAHTGSPSGLAKQASRQRELQPDDDQLALDHLLRNRMGFGRL
jgi:hypothetical protein